MPAANYLNEEGNPLRVHFTTSLDLHMHPLLKDTHKMKLKYYYVLDSLVTYCSNDTEYIRARLDQYQVLLFGSNDIPNFATTDCGDKSSTTIADIADSTVSWKKKYWLWLLCDTSLILLDQTALHKSHQLIKQNLTRRQCVKFDKWLSILSGDKPIPFTMRQSTSLIRQYQINRYFNALPEKRFMITANMSAGKSTLINALTGKPLVKTAQEACTANLCFLHNKPFEDHGIHLLPSPINLRANQKALAKSAETGASFIAAYFRTLVKPQFRICMIDTPGVNSALHCDHASLTHKSLSEEDYTKLVYVFNANKLGTTEESNYLKYISENVPEEKVIFVLNKLDDFRYPDDSIATSFITLKNELLQLGYHDPILCPISAYFALLIKRIHHNEKLTKEEQCTYDFYSEKFNIPEYDLSQYYDGVSCLEKDSETMRLSKKCGLYGLENILWRN